MAPRAEGDADMIKTLIALGMLAATVPAVAQDATSPATLPRCSSKVKDSCDQGANDPKAMSASQAEAHGGVGDRADDGKGGAMSSGSFGHGRAMHHKTIVKTRVTQHSETPVATSPVQ
ncbi:MAG: hypothetical protein ACRYG4_16385 [Janthinobacterium lividum]